MTRTRYGFAVLLQSFGVIRKTKRLTDAAFESHLMQDGEELLGKFCWPKVEGVEELSMEYWNIRKLERERNELIEKIAESERTLETAHAKRTEISDKSKDLGQELLETREELFLALDTLNSERDGVMTEAQSVKRRYEALKMKAKVLKEEGQTGNEDFAQCRTDLAELKEQFQGYKSTLDRVEGRIAIEQEKLDSLQAEIDDKLKGTRDEASESFGLISRANKDITKYQAELGLIQEEQSKLCREIGRFLNINGKTAQTRTACQEHRGLLEQTRLLRRSVQLNRRLIERVS